MSSHRNPRNTTKTNNIKEASVEALQEVTPSIPGTKTPKEDITNAKSITAISRALLGADLPKIISNTTKVPILTIRHKIIADQERPHKIILPLQQMGLIQDSIDQFTRVIFRSIIMSLLKT